MSTNRVDILLVEDSLSDARLVREFLLETSLTGSGSVFRVSHVSVLEKAIDLLAQEQIDIVLLDLSLPDSEGLDTLYQMLKAAPQLPIVVLSGLDDEAVAIEAVKAGAQDYLVKGYINEFFLPRVIHYAIERKLAEEKVHRNRELALLNTVIAASTTYSTPEEILEVVCQELGKTFDLPQVTAILLDEDKSGAVVVAQHLAQNQANALGKTISLAHPPLLQRFFNQPGPVTLAKTENEPSLDLVLERLHQFEIEVELILPIRINEENIGNLLLAINGSRQFSIEEIDLAWSVADQVAGSLARARLNQARQLLSMAIEQTAESIIITDPQGFILYVNPAFEHVSGYTRTEVQGCQPNILNSGHHNSEFYQTMWHMISAGQVWHGQFVNKKKDGTLYTEEATITPITNLRGEIVNYVAVKRDVTQELQRQERYRQAQKMEAVGRLAGGVAHDFNNLLTVITGYTELLLDRYKETSDPTNRDLEQIKQASERAASLTRQLLAFGRKQIIQPTVLHLNDIITDMGKMLQRLIGEDIDLITTPATDLGAIKADPGQIEQIIMNLVINGRDAMPHGGKLTIETANIYLDETYVDLHLNAKPGWYVMLAVTDSGLGMDHDTQAKIFEPFFTTKSQDRGTGLGLATVYGIVKQSGGNIWVYSELEQGTTFKVYLPRLDQPVRPTNQQVHQTRPQTGTETILLVEDEGMVREMVFHVLREHGYTVLQASTGQEAVVAFQNHQKPIHLLLTDVIIPGGVSGPELGKRLLSLQPKMRVLYMSGYPDNNIMHQGLLNGGSAFLQKPFAPDTLAHRVREVLDG